jgi:Mg-chelatase subunit ChlD
MLKIITVTSALSALAFAQSCTSFDETTCKSDTSCAWTGTSCICASGKPLDMVFTLDSSFSILPAEWQVQLGWVSEMIGNLFVEGESRAGFVRFSDYSTILMRLPESTAYTISGLQTYAQNIAFVGGLTNTLAALEDTLTIFEESQANDADYSQREHVMVLITDGNPNPPADVCNTTQKFRDLGVDVVVVGVGNDWTPDHVGCLVSDPNLLVYASGYDASVINQIMPILVGVACPKEATALPTAMPTVRPTGAPIKAPTKAPTARPTGEPTIASTSGCDSTVPPDVIFVLDSSFSIVPNDYTVEKDWVAELIADALTDSTDSRVAFIRFADTSDILLTLAQSETMSNAERQQFARDIAFSGGLTNTYAALNDSLRLFRRDYIADRKRIVMLISDGVPNPNVDLCPLGADFNQLAATFVVVGVSSEFNRTKIDCLVSDPNLILEVDSYDPADTSAVVQLFEAANCGNAPPTASPLKAPTSSPTVRPTNAPIVQPTHSPVISSCGAAPPDIIFALDSSFSILPNDYEVQLGWVSRLIGSELSNSSDSRVGFIRFADISEVLLTLVQSESMTTAQRQEFALNIVFSGGVTNTLAALQDALSMFTTEYIAQNSRILLLITDGVPNPDANLCPLKSSFDNLGVTIVVVGVTEAFTTDRVACLVNDTRLLLHLQSYDAQLVNEIISTLRVARCETSAPTMSPTIAQLTDSSDSSDQQSGNAGSSGDSNDDSAKSSDSSDYSSESSSYVDSENHHHHHRHYHHHHSSHHSSSSSSD